MGNKSVIWGEMVLTTLIFYTVSSQWPVSHIKCCHNIFTSSAVFRHAAYSYSQPGGGVWTHIQAWNAVTFTWLVLEVFLSSVWWNTWPFGLRSGFGGMDRYTLAIEISLVVCLQSLSRSIVLKLWDHLWKFLHWLPNMNVNRWLKHRVSGIDRTRNLVIYHNIGNFTAHIEVDITSS